MIYQELVSNICDKINFNTYEFAKNYKVNDNFDIVDSSNLKFYPIDTIDNGILSILFKVKVEFIVNGLILQITDDTNLTNRTLLLNINNKLIETTDYFFKNGNLQLYNVDYNNITELYYIDKTMFSGNYELIGSDILRNISRNLNEINTSKYSIYKCLSQANIYFTESEDKLESFNIEENAIYIIPSGNVGSKSNNTFTIALAENFVGSDYVLSRLHNFFLLVKINKIAYNPINNRLDNRVLFKVLDEVLPAVIKTTGGFIPKNIHSAISYKDDALYMAGDGYLIYRINFEFISTLTSIDLMEDVEYNINNIISRQGVKLDGN